MQLLTPAEVFTAVLPTRLSTADTRTYVLCMEIYFNCGPLSSGLLSCHGANLARLGHLVSRTFSYVLGHAQCIEPVSYPRGSTNKAEPEVEAGPRFDCQGCAWSMHQWLISLQLESHICPRCSILLVVTSEPSYNKLHQLLI